METRVHFCGLGKIATGALSELAERHGAEKFVAVSRKPRRERSPYSGVPVVSYEELAGSDGPVVVCLSTDEARAIAAHRARGLAVEELRTAVALPNLKLLDGVIRGPHWKTRLVLVMTNPVEVITHYLRAITGNARIFGLGLTTDRQRMAEALASAFEVDVAEMPVVTGFHYLDPVPVLSAERGVREGVASVPHAQVVRRLGLFASPYMTPGAHGIICATFNRLMQAGESVPGAFAYDRLRAAAHAITAGEFEADRPPVRRAIDNLVSDVSALLAGEPVAVSAAEGGGLLHEGRFTRPSLNPLEGTLVEKTLARHVRFLLQMDRQLKSTRFGRGGRDE